MCVCVCVRALRVRREHCVRRGSLSAFRLEHGTFRRILLYSLVPPVGARRRASVCRGRRKQDLAYFDGWIGLPFAAGGQRANLDKEGLCGSRRR